MHIRRVHHLFPIRPYLPALVEALEDQDATVRGTAQSSVVELFTGPAVTDAARADLKKEMTKKGVRKGIVESVLAKVLGGGGGGGGGGGSTPHTGSDAGSEAGDLPQGNALPTNKRPVTSAAPSAPSRVVSTSRGEPSRPASRAASVPPVPDAAANGSADVKPVYVSVLLATLDVGEGNRVPIKN